MTDPEFSPDRYRALLQALHRQGYECRNFHDFSPESRHVILRHDIDFSPTAARRLAEIERQEAWCATYFFLLRSEFYNPNSRSCVRDMQSILAEGHEIGLHFDASQYDDDQAVLDEAASTECAALENLIGRSVQIVSFHRPVASFQNRGATIGGRLHTYMPKFFSEIGYCSDSQGVWRFGTPLENAAVKSGRALQLLTHPIWWMTEGATAVDKLQRFFDERSAALDESMAENCLPWSRQRQLRLGY